MRALSLLALASVAVAVPLAQASPKSENVWFNNCEIVLDHNIDTKVVGMSFTLRPADAVCDAANFTLPSPVFNCGKTNYSFSIKKTEGYYSRYTVHISHALESSNVLEGDLTFGTNGPIPWLHDQVGTANGTLTAA